MGGPAWIVPRNPSPSVVFNATAIMASTMTNPRPIRRPRTLRLRYRFASATASTQTQRRTVGLRPYKFVNRPKPVRAAKERQVQDRHHEQVHILKDRIARLKFAYLCLRTAVQKTPLAPCNARIRCLSAHRLGKQNCCWVHGMSYTRK